MKQYCRYCSNFFTGNGNWCEEKEFSPTDEQAKRINKCKSFLFNPEDAFYTNTKGYTPREVKEKQPDGQMSMLDIEYYEKGKGKQWDRTKDI